MERVSLITANFKIEQFSAYINLHFSSSESLIFTSRVSDLLTLVYPLADSASVDIICSEVPGHPINLHIVDRFNYDTSFKLFSCCLLCVNGKKSYQPLGGSDIRTKIESKRIGDWLAKMPIAMG